MLQNPEFVKYTDVVPCIAHQTKTHGSTEVVVNPKTKETRKSCEIYPSISCDVHEGFMRVGLKIEGTPSSFICGPDGVPLVKPDDEGGKWYRAVAPLTKKLQEIQAKLGRPYPRPLYDKVIRDLAGADEDAAQGKYEKAVKTVTRYAEDRKIPEAMKQGRLKEKLAALDAKGQEMLEEAKGKHESEPDEALKLAKKVQKEFKGLESAKAATELLKEWTAAGADKS